MLRFCSRLFAVFFAVAVLAAPAPKPDLVVVVAIDQFPDRYLRIFQPYFSAGGFNRFLQHGADFTRALYPYATTETGPGHASIGTGELPSRSGIVTNTWFDRMRGKNEYCVDDPRAGGFSPLNLASDSLADRLEESSSNSKVFGVSLKDRAAILMAGRKGTAAYWFDHKAHAFTTSRYYHSNPAALDAFNKTVPAIVDAHKEWIQSTFIPAADLQRITNDPPTLRKYKGEHEGLGVSFPHPLNGIDAVLYTPFGNELVLGFAEQLLASENIGTADGAPDILYISLSSQDYLGHDYGPDSLEVADSVVRVDRQLERFFADLDVRFGDRYVLALTSDHGVQSIPEVAKEMGRDAGRVSLKEPTSETKTLGQLVPQRLAIETRAAARLGLKVSEATPIGDRLILDFSDPGLYINWARVRDAKLDGERVKRALRDAALTVKGIQYAFTNSELLVPSPDAIGVERSVRNSFRADRSGDVIMALRAGYIWNSNGKGATHGQAVEDDQHVPLLMWGRGITPGKYDMPVAPTDLARTLGALLGVEAGGEQSVVLPCVKQ
jgi:arylsulfatase A-like enzyme